jgi:hypothetical protein
MKDKIDYIFILGISIIIVVFFNIIQPFSDYMRFHSWYTGPKIKEIEERLEKLENERKNRLFS